MHLRFAHRIGFVSILRKQSSCRANWREAQVVKLALADAARALMAPRSTDCSSWLTWRRWWTSSSSSSLSTVFDQTHVDRLTNLCRGGSNICSLGAGQWGPGVWTHWIQAPFSYLQSPHHHQASISAPPHHHSTSLQQSLLITCNSRSSTYIIFSTYYWSLFSICFAMSLEPAFSFTASTSFTSDSFLSLSTSVILLLVFHLLFHHQ